MFGADTLEAASESCPWDCVQVRNSTLTFNLS
jgi:hypothetical protein